ncbi:MAG: acyl-CoA dehydrogenase family protein [Gammaproteobacteria bacterium]
MLPNLPQPGTRAQALTAAVASFIDERIIPAEADYFDYVENAATPWCVVPVMDELKSAARAAGLWNLWCPDEDYGAGLSNLEYAHIAERMGRSLIGSEPFNCSAPDTGNMEVLIRYGSADHQARWLRPLLEGEIRSAFCMTEPAVASSDATNIECAIERDGDHFVVSGHKWWSSGAMDPRCEMFIVMGKTDPSAARHQQQSMILVPRDTEGVTVVRPMRVFGDADAPHGHAEVMFEQVRVPAENMILGAGRGFEIAQGRLGPGRIHHCMRLIGLAQRALEAMCQRANDRVAFGKPLAAQGSVREVIARSACEIEQARLLTLHAAHKLDVRGNKAARNDIGMIKIVAPTMAQAVIDRAIQIHGALGLSQDSFLARAFAGARSIRLADGPDEVHLAALGKRLVATNGVAD